MAPGRCLDYDKGLLSAATLGAWGSASARLGRALRGFWDPLMTRRSPWDVRHAGGAFTIWPRSHARIWQHTRECMRDGRGYHPYQDEALYPRTRAALSSRRIAL